MARVAASREGMLHLERDGIPVELAAQVAEEDLDSLRDLTRRLGVAHVKQLAEALENGHSEVTAHS
jgi:hypothetical protein